MAGQDRTGEHYKAFISYSQKDSAEADKVQNWLERYRLPKALAKPGKHGRRIGKIFRDKTDLTAEPEVWGALQEKIAASEHLIVLCSPNAAQSEWVDKEIRHFRATGRADKVLALIISGTPNSGDPATECFPPTFRETEPLAANLVTDGRQSALTRVTASLANVPFDALWQRERRRQRRQMALGGSLLALGLLLTVAAGGASWLALKFQDQAKSSAAEAKEYLSEAEQQRALANSERERAEQQSTIAKEQRRLANQEQERAEEQSVRAEEFFERAQAQSALAETRLANVERQSSDILAREAKVIFNSDNPDMATSLLMALQADPSASRTSLRHHFDGKSGYAFARARMVAGHANNRVIQVLESHENTVWSVAVMPDGRLVTGSDDNTVRLWDPESGEELRAFRGHEDTITAVAVTPDGCLVTGSYDRTARLWDMETGEELRAFSGHHRRVTSVAVTPDGRLVTGSDDNTARLWDMETGEELRAFTGHQGSVMSVAVMPDGRLVTGSYDRTARLWDPESGEELRAFRGHEDTVRSVAVTPDGRLVTGSSDGTARLWQLPDIVLEPDPKKQVEMACMQLWKSNDKLAFTRSNAVTYPVLLGEPRVDPDDPDSDFISPCRCFLPDEVFEHPANKCPGGLPG